MKEMKSKVISDKGYGATKQELRQGYSSQTIKEDQEDYFDKWDEKQKYKKIGFGRSTGHDR